MAPLKRKNVMTLDELTDKARGGPCIAKLAGRVSGRQERKSARGNRFAFAQLSDPTGAYEVTIFSDTLEKCREHLETGSKVVVTVKAEMESDQLKLLAQSMTPVETIVADAGNSGLKIYLDDASAVGPVANILEGAKETMKNMPKGPIWFCLTNMELPGEVEIDAGAGFPVNPQIKSALKSVEGVMAVEEI